MVRNDRTGVEHVETSYRGSEPLAFRESSRASSSHTENATRLPLAAVLLVTGGLVSGVAYAAGLGPLLGWVWGSFSATEAWWAKVLIALGTLGGVSAFGAVIWWLAKRLGEDFRHW